MRIKRIEIEGRAGHVAIERAPGSTTIRVDSFCRDPKVSKQIWLPMELPVRIDETELFKVAERVQHRCDGVRGTNSDILGYFRELERFID